eukprot:tig00020675_g12689.t1
MGDLLEDLERCAIPDPDPAFVSIGQDVAIMREAMAANSNSNGSGRRLLSVGEAVAIMRSPHCAAVEELDLQLFFTSLDVCSDDDDDEFEDGYSYASSSRSSSLNCANELLPTLFAAIPKSGSREGLAAFANNPSGADPRGAGAADVAIELAADRLGDGDRDGPLRRVLDRELHAQLQLAARQRLLSELKRTSLSALLSLTRRARAHMGMDLGPRDVAGLSGSVSAFEVGCFVLFLAVFAFSVLCLAFTVVVAVSSGGVSLGGFA